MDGGGLAAVVCEALLWVLFDVVLVTAGRAVVASAGWAMEGLPSRPAISSRHHTGRVAGSAAVGAAVARWPWRWWRWWR